MNPTAVLEAPVLSNLILLRMLKLLFVRCLFHLMHGTNANVVLAKFTGYQYGGRPLGLTFVKYQTPGDAMDGAEQTGGMTQDQMM